MNPGNTAASWLERWLRRLALRDRVRFVERALKESEAPGTVLDIGPDAPTDPRATPWKYTHPPGSCALVTMFQVLEHVYDPAGYLEAARELLAPEGRLIVQVPNAACWQFLLFGERWSGLDVPRHLIDFRLADLEALLDRCGFEVLRRKHFSLRDNPAGMASSMAPGLDPSARRIRGVRETPPARLVKDALFLGLAAACLPFALLEASCRAGSTVILEARKKS